MMTYRADKEDDIEMEVDISDSLVSGSGGEEEVTHVFASLMMDIVDLMQNQFPKMVDKAPSLVMVSSPA